MKEKMTSFSLTENEVVLETLHDNNPKVLELVRVGCFPNIKDLYGMDTPNDGISFNFLLRHKKSREIIAFLTADYKRGSKNIVQFDNVCTLQKWRGKKVMPLMLRLVRQWYRRNRKGIYSFNIRIEESKEGLVNFYKQQGFEQYCKRSENQDTILFLRDIF
jgi:predicted GNAT family N-acyltransferase